MRGVADLLPCREAEHFLKATIFCHHDDDNDRNYDDDDYDDDEGAESALVHCCTLSLCYLGVETGYRVGTPYSRM